MTPCSSICIRSKSKRSSSNFCRQSRRLKSSAEATIVRGAQARGACAKAPWDGSGNNPLKCVSQWRRMKGMEDQILRRFGRKDYVPLNVPELLRHLGLRPGEQQVLQRVLRALEQSG